MLEVCSRPFGPRAEHPGFGHITFDGQDTNIRPSLAAADNVTFTPSEPIPLGAKLMRLEPLKRTHVQALADSSIFAQRIGSKDFAFRYDVPDVYGNTLEDYSSEEAQLSALQALDPDVLGRIVALAERGRKLGSGRDAAAFALAGFDKLALRAIRAAARGGSALSCIPVRYTERLEWLLREPTVGIPRAVLVPLTHPFAARQWIEPAEITAVGVPPIALTLLRRTPGRRPGETYVAEYQTLITCIRQSAAVDAPARAVDQAYALFCAAYDHALTILAALPQAAFNRAVAILAHARRVSTELQFDFQHTGNMNFAYDIGNINFFDLAFSREVGGTSAATTLDEVFGIFIGKHRVPEWKLIRRIDRPYFRGIYARLLARFAAAAQVTDYTPTSEMPEWGLEFFDRFGMTLPSAALGNTV